MLTVVWAEHITVTITNKLERKEDLNVHCKSKDNDIGQHLLHINQSFNWVFENNFLGDTLFFCSFQWKKDLLLYIDAYDKVGIMKYVKTVIDIFITTHHVGTNQKV